MSRNAGGTNLKVAAGDRAPDAPGLNAAGEPVRLFDYFRGPHFTLLRLFSDNGSLKQPEQPDVKSVEVRTSTESKSGEQVFVDEFGHFAEAYGGKKNDYLLVRPDGYVGWIGSAEKLPDLHRYLSITLNS